MYWTGGKDKKARVILGDLDVKTYKVLIASPLVQQPNLITFNTDDGYVYFTDGDQKTVKKVKPSVGLVSTVEMTKEPIVRLVSGYGKVYWITSDNQVSWFLDAGQD